MNFFLCRLPGGKQVICGASAQLHRGLGDGFNIAPYMEHPKDDDIIRIACGFGAELEEETLVHNHDYDCEAELYTDASRLMQWAVENDSEYASAHPFPEGATTKEAHIGYVRATIAEATRLQEISGHNAKIIAARIDIKTISHNITVNFERLCKAYPHAFVFCFSTPLTGTWIGATPEILISVKDSCATSYALAGTRKFSGAMSDGQDWHPKDVTEHNIVKDFIGDALQDVTGQIPEIMPTVTVDAGPVQHLLTEIHFSPLESYGSYGRLLEELSPTPAISGLPRREAMAFIEKNESIKREFYGGFCGYVGGIGNINLYATLRCGRIDTVGKRIALYGGGGITSESVPEAEWLESEAKLSTLRNIL